MTPKEIIYAVSITLQVSGSVLLLLYYFRGSTRDLAIHEYFPGSNVAYRDDENNITLEKEKLQRTVVLIYKNRAAFVMLAVGYLIGIFGRNDGHEFAVAGLVVVMTAIVILSINAVCKKLAQRRYNADEKIPYENVESFVDTVITSAEIDELCDEVFGSGNDRLDQSK